MCIGEKWSFKCFLENTYINSVQRLLGKYCCRLFFFVRTSRENILNLYGWKDISSRLLWRKHTSTRREGNLHLIPSFISLLPARMLWKIVKIGKQMCFTVMSHSYTFYKESNPLASKCMLIVTTEWRTVIALVY